jgi:hypothetical protein
MSDLQKLLASLKSMTVSTQFMEDLPGSEAVRVDRKVLDLMENSAKLLAQMAERVRTLAAKIMLNAPENRVEFRDPRK